MQVGDPCFPHHTWWTLEMPLRHSGTFPYATLTKTPPLVELCVAVSMARRQCLPCQAPSRPI